MKKTLLFLATTLMGILPFVACSDNNDEFNEPLQFHYSRIIPNANSGLSFSIDSLGASVRTIAGAPDWLEVTSELDDNNMPVLFINHKQSESGDEREAKLVITAVNNNIAYLTVTQVPDYDESNEENDVNKNWLTNWENCETVKLVGIDLPQYTPWADQAETTAYPNIVQGLTKANGWEMAFSALNDVHAKNRRYFGLYNRFLGILRVFCYVNNPGSTASVGLYEVQMGNCHNQNANIFPFYNSLAFAIPTSHVATGKDETSLNLNTNLLGKHQDFVVNNTTFQDFKDTYNKSNSRTLKPGWNVFDINMSGYVPEDKRWIDDSENQGLFINCFTSSESTLNIAGRLAAKIGGEFTEQEIVQHGSPSLCQGIASALNTIGGATSSVVRYGQYAMEEMAYNKFTGGGGATGWDKFYMTGLRFIQIFSTGSSLAAGLLNTFGGSVSYDTIPGKIDLSMDGTINLDGTMKSFVPNTVGSINVTKRLIKTADNTKPAGTSHFGTGVISLAEDPVVCVAAKDILANVPNFNLLAKDSADFKYRNPLFDSCHVRLITFLDPTSLKLNLNTKAYGGNVTDVRVNATLCVFPNAPYGSTEDFRKVLGLKRPVVDLKLNNKGDFFRYNNSSDVHVHQIRHTKLINDLPNLVEKEAHKTTPPEDEPESEKNCQLISQEGSNIKYYGRLVSAAGKPCIVEPQVYVPYRRVNRVDGDDRGNSVWIENGKIPDYVVCVMVHFKVDDKPYFFSLHYLPRIQLLDHAQLLEKREQLQQFKEKCKNAQPISTLQNNPSVNVYFPYGGSMTYKALKMLDPIK